MSSSRVAVTDPYGNRSADRILVSRRQEGNPVLRYIRNVKWEMADIVPDFLLGRRAAAIFISLRFHRIKPGYLYGRLRELQRSFRLRIVIVHIDIKDPVVPLEDISKLTLFNEATMVCGFSPEECGRILETYKAYENKSADTIQEKTEQDYVSRMMSVITTVRGVNRRDALELGARRDSVAGIFSSSKGELQDCEGIGDRKVQRLHDAFHLPFRLSTQKAAEERLAKADAPKSVQEEQEEKEKEESDEKEKEKEKGKEKEGEEEKAEPREKLLKKGGNSPSESQSSSDFEELEF